MDDRPLLRTVEEVEDETGSGGEDHRSSTGSFGSDSEWNPYEEGAYPRKLKRAAPHVNSLDVEAMQVTGQAHSNIPEDPSLFIALRLAFETLGVVYSGLGTSPLYVYSTTFSDVEIGGTMDVLGTLSVIIYMLTLIPLIKYVFIVLRANCNGEGDFKGGSFSLYSIVCRYAKASLIPNRQPADDELSHLKVEIPTKSLERAMKIKGRLEKSVAWKTFLLVIALLGVSLVICDGIFTPCISVMAAVDGLVIKFPSLSQDVPVVITIILLIFLFNMQRFGTGKVKFFFAPVLCIWFLAIAAIGIYNIIKYDHTIFRAFNPAYMYYLFSSNKINGFYVLGGLVLCISGAEAMFADLGNFPIKSIQIAFGTMVYPCLLLAYMGQAAYLMKYPLGVNDVFYSSVPDVLFWPVFVIAVLAALIASRSMILATSSVVNMALALDCFPRVKIIHTSRRFMGQMYIPTINWFLLIMCVLVTAFSRSTSTDYIAHAFGVAFLGDMLVTTGFATLIMIMIWQTPLLLSIAFVLVIGGVELLSLISVLLNFTHGGWVPVVVAAVLVTVMYVWHYGTRMKYQSEVEQRISMDYMKQLGANLGTVRVPGVGLLYNELVQGIPAIFGYFIKSLPATHSTIVFVCIKYINVPVVPQSQRFIFRRVCSRDYHLFRCVARYGYKDVRKEDHTIFEDLLLQSLEIFIQKEAQEYALEFESFGTEYEDGERPQSYETSLLTDEIFTPEPLADTSNESKATCSRSFVEESIGRSPSPVVLDDIAETEISVVRNAKESGLVYLLGHADVRAKKSSWFFRKLVINYFYSFLYRNCRSTTELLNVPHTNLMQVGMTYMV